MIARISLALVLHNHQPIGNFDWVIEKAYRTAYEPMLGALERHPGVRLGLHYSGPLLEWIESSHPEAIERLRVLVDRGQVEILGGGWYEPVLAALSEADRMGQLRCMGDELERRFGRRPRGAWLAERVWEPSLPADLARAGYAWTILDDHHLRGASVAEDAMWTAFTTDDRGERVNLFGTEQGLRYRIPFGEVDDLIAYLRAHATTDGRRIGMMGDDGEKFGAWPTTYEHCWGAGRWVERCFTALEANASWLATTTPSSWLEREPPATRIYPPTSSYVEMTEWALPPDEAGLFHDALARGRAVGSPEARFLQGGTWRNFQARYREIGELHKQMLRVSRKVASMPEGPVRDRALRHLYRGQSNDCYWHGLFGGIYIVHLRLATLAELIAAEDLADAALPAAASQLVDWDLDGLDEVLLTTPSQVVAVDLAEGAGISGWDLRASRTALLSVLRRRPEAYHARLAAESPARTPTAGAAASIHELIPERQPGLTELLRYDSHERRAGLVRFLPAGTSAETVYHVAEDELGDFIDRPFRLEHLSDGQLTASREGHVSGEPVRVEKTIALDGGRLVPQLRLAVTVEHLGTVPLDCDLVLEWSFNLAGGGGNPAAWYEAPARGGAAATARSPHDSTGAPGQLTTLAFGNDDTGVRVDLALAPGADVAWFPVETISSSEVGFERVYQGSCLLLRWPIRMDAGDRRRVTATFAVTQPGERAGDAPG